MVKAACFESRNRGFKPRSGIQVSKKQNVASLLTRSRFNIVVSLHAREVASSATDHQGSNFESCVLRAVSSHSSHNLQEVLLVQFSLYVHKGGLKPIHFILYSHYNDQAVYYFT